MSYLSVSDFRRHKGIEATGDDASIVMLIDAAEKAIENYCNRTFAGEEEARTYDVPLDGVLYLDDDLASITSITNGDGTTVASSEYVTDPRNAVAKGKPIWAIRLKAGSSTYWRSASGVYEDAITITGVWGYSATPPADIVHACYMLAAYYYDSRESIGAEVNIVPGVSVTIPQGMPLAVKRLLENGRYVREF